MLQGDNCGELARKRPLSAGPFDKLLVLVLARIGELSLKVLWPLRFAGFLAYAVMVSFLLLAPAKVVTAYYPSIPGLDKAFHFSLFGLLVLLARWAFPNPSVVVLNGWWVPVCAVGYGAVIELAQGWLVTYGRSFEWADILANTLGALSFWCLSSALFSANRPNQLGIMRRSAVQQ